MKYCTNCGAEINENAAICVKCGVALIKKPTKNKTIAGLLAIFLGGLGIHKFYLGKTILGIVYLLFCWTYIPSIIGFIEGIIYFCTDEEKFALKYS